MFLCIIEIHLCEQANENTQYYLLRLSLLEHSLAEIPA